MPSFIHINAYSGESRRVDYATEDQLLDFANKVRKAGGGDPIEGFFPAKPSSSTSCLIAKALNFGCSVDVDDNNEVTDRETWAMYLEGTDQLEVDARVRKIAKATGTKILTKDYDDFYDEVPNEDAPDEVAYGILLPARIGNTALAFDHAKSGWILKYRESANS
jgi:hypothetical protein